MAKRITNEQENINKERLIDIVLVIQYIEQFDINKDFLTDRGEGFLEGIASVKNELLFISKKQHQKELKKLQNTINSQKEYIKKLYDELKRKKRNRNRWF